jgi:hypothetical protein
VEKDWGDVGERVEGTPNCGWFFGLVILGIVFGSLGADLGMGREGEGCLGGGGFDLMLAAWEGSRSRTMSTEGQRDQAPRNECIEQNSG